MRKKLATQLMKKYNFQISISCLITLIVISISCNGPTPPDPYLRFAERWKFINSESNVNQVSTDPLAIDKDVSDQNLFIQFYTNQSFITNADLSLSKLTVNNRGNFSGVYYYFKENGEDRMILEFFDESIRDDVALYFLIENLSSNTPTMIMNTNDYKTSINESADKMNSEISDELKAFANRIITANFTLEFEKQ